VYEWITLMIEITRIICPVDFSSFSRRALDFAMGIARWYDADVLALHVQPIGVPPMAVAPGAPVMMEPILMSGTSREQLMQDLRAFVESERAVGVAIEMRVSEGTIWREIVAEAKPAGDLIVLGTHGRSGFERLLLGSVTEKILRTSPCPVLTVPRSAPDAVPIAPGLFKRILCATDFSTTSDVALTWATSLAQEADAELLVLHVLEASTVTELESFPRSALAAYRREYEEWSLARLREAVPESVKTNCTVKELMSVGRVDREILRVAGEHEAELIVMGVSGHRGVGDRIFGSTTQHVVRAAACPVLTVRAA
jgi:nucleotide-binding universal stress UspA family protein